MSPPKTTTTRRTQEQRRRETSNRLIAATIAVLGDRGYSGLKASDITRAAGVTWGAVQHLFGDKNSLLLAVASRTYEELATSLRTDVRASASLGERVEQMIDVTWRAYQTDSYFAMVEILRGSKSARKFHQELVDRQQLLNEEVRQTWLRWFANSGIEADAIDRARELVTLTLSGLAARRLFLRANRTTRPTLQTLSVATLHVLQTATRPAQRK